MDQQRRNSSLLEIEAADYFRLDPSQVHMLHQHRNSVQVSIQIQEPNRKPLKSGFSPQSFKDNHTQFSAHQYLHSEPQMPLGLDTNKAKHCKPLGASGGGLQSMQAKRQIKHIQQTNRKQLVKSDDCPPVTGLSYTRKHPALVRKSPVSGSGRDRCVRTPNSDQLGRSSSLLADSCGQQKNVESSTTSTNSLPSISSSPSVSPSLLCPHMSIDDILKYRNLDDPSKSPHTIGLCTKCRLDPPPDIHSPLSPAFKPFNQVPRSNTSLSIHYNRKSCSMADDVVHPSRGQTKTTRILRRGHSDHQIGVRKDDIRKKTQARDDSLDFAVDSEDLKRLQLPPTLRNSVEYIRNNSIESGRVIRVYKNGHPFDRPLRVCITSKEFSTLNNLLEYINGRLLIPSGARYLFHLDGQLVYSVKELKHGSSYVVSGVRMLDNKSNSIIKDQINRELQLTAQRLQQRKSDVSGSLNSLNRSSTERIADLKLTDQNVAPKKSIARISTPKVRPKKLIDKKVSTSSRNEQLDAESKKFSASETNLASDNNDTHFNELKTIETPTKCVRAKSELSALPPKRKKMVTFMDTGRGSSPAIPTSSSDTSSVQERRSASKIKEKVRGSSDMNQHNAKPRVVPADELIRRNEIGIQVSDSLDGYLIDLPIAVPGGRGDDKIPVNRSKVGARPGKTKLSKVVGSRDPKTIGAAKGSNKSQQRSTSRPRPKVVAITERQLSVDEMEHFRDLDHGDHHSEASKIQMVTIKLESVDGDQLSTDENEQQSSGLGDGGWKDEVVPDRTGTINIGSDPSDAQLNNQTVAVTSKADEPDNSLWQHPEGRDSSATPIERPVSQSEANEMVHARVTTPTPSLSTLGDSNSLSMCYEAATVTTDRGDANWNEIARVSGSREFGPEHLGARELAPKEHVPVIGRLCEGSEIPARNFRLLWVNGFTINDQYPDNSSAVLLGPTQEGSGANNSVSLSPQRNPSTSRPSIMDAFKLSERFNNWICHSRKHDELVYPAGALIVLWCRWTDGQRFYSRHKANVCALTLVSMEPDLAASAQIGAADGDPSQVHIWSLTRLETLRVVSDDHFRGRLIFSLRAKHSAGSGCQLLVAAKDDKRLWVSQLNFRLSLTAGGRRATSSGDKGGGSSSQVDASGGATRDRDESAATSGRASVRASGKLSSSGSGAGTSSNCTNQTPDSITVIKESKLLPANQYPLFILPIGVEQQQRLEPLGAAPSRAIKAASVAQTTEPISQADSAKQQPTLLPTSQCDLLLSFGRRHFQLWAPDKRQRKMRLLQPETKSPTMGELMVRATSLARVSPMEFLLGDVEGNVALVELDCKLAASATTTTTTKTSAAVDRLAKLQKYHLRVRPLVGPMANGSARDSSDLSPPSAARDSHKSAPAAITCLSRVSGSIFATADSSCRIKFWKIERKSSGGHEADASTKCHSASSCRQVSCIALPQDLGFICTILATNYVRREARVEFYVVSTSNAILFGSVQLELEPNSSTSAQILANSSLSVVYEGHETSVMNVVADYRTPEELEPQKRSISPVQHDYYFTCSLDCKICKWDGKRLVWKSVLPSACASLAVHPTGFVLAIGSVDGTVYVLDKLTGLLISYFPLTPVRINCLAYTRDGGLMAAGCANGSIFVLPVYEHGLKYRKVSIFQSPFPVMSIQFSLDSRHILTSVTHDSYQELILWDLPKFRYMKDNVKVAADRIAWFDSICSASEDVRATWESINLQPEVAAAASRKASGSAPAPSFVVNVCCHRLVHADDRSEDYAIAGDTRGHLRLFKYPAYDIEQGFYEARVSSSPVNCCRFLAPTGTKETDPLFVSSSLDGSVCLWKLD